MQQKALCHEVFHVHAMLSIIYVSLFIHVFSYLVS